MRPCFLWLKVFYHQLYFSDSQLISLLVIVVIFIHLQSNCRQLGCFFFFEPLFVVDDRSLLYFHWKTSKSPVLVGLNVNTGLREYQIDTSYILALFHKECCVSSLSIFVIGYQPPGCWKETLSLCFFSTLHCLS